MTIQNAQLIVQRIGPCRIMLDLATSADIAAELALSGCEIRDITAAGAGKGSRGKSAGFLTWKSAKIAGFGEALRAFSHMDALVLETAGQHRASFEAILFAGGWRRHAGGMLLHEYPAWSGHVLPPITFYERAGEREKSLFVEGVEADSIIARYAMAATHVRPGDHVLLDGMASAEGAAILLALSRAGSVTRVGRGGRDSVGPNLARLADQSIDIVVAFEPATPDGWQARLNNYFRVMRFDGRLVFGLCQPGGDLERPRGWAEFSEEVSARFLPEIGYEERQITNDPDGPRYLGETGADEPAGVDWFILVASANPLLGEGCTDSFTHPGFAGRPLPALVDFGTAYDNPWLYRSMVQMGERMRDDFRLTRLAECVIEDSHEGSADRGAAIAVLGYRVLEMRNAEFADLVLPFIAAYIDQPLTDDTPPHVRRWRISLAFLAGRLCELTGDRGAAKTWYRQAADAKWEDFSPLLATKAIAASFYEARIHLAEGNAQTAFACFRQGSDTALRAAAFPHEAQMMVDGKPLPFYLQELAEVIDMGSQCAGAIAHFHLWERDPGLFWRQVDLRRFGLASWARDLERENKRLLAA